MKTLIVILAALLLAGCSKAPEAVATTPTVQTPATTPNTDGLALDNTTPNNVPTRNAPTENVSGGYKIVPSDRSKFPSNAAGGG